MSTIEQTTIPTGTWTLDPVHSQAGFAVKTAAAATFRGHFGEFTAQLEDGTLSGAVDVASVQVTPQMFKDHLQSPDFFDTESHPQITFSSSDLTVDGERLTIRGDLTIRGTTKPLEAIGELGGPFTALDGSEKIGLSLETVVNRHDFGVSWNADLPSGGKAVADDVKLTVDLTLVKA